jgi:hypothetical protein
VVVDTLENATHLRLAQHDRDAGRAVGSLESINELELPLEEFTIKEQQRVERLVLSGGGDMAVGGEVGEELADLDRTHFLRMPFGVEEDEPANPVDVGLFSSDGELFEPHDFPTLVEKAEFWVGDEAFSWFWTPL